MALSLEQKASLLSPSAGKEVNKRRTRKMSVAQSVDQEMNVQLLISVSKAVKTHQSKL